MIIYRLTTVDYDVTGMGHVSWHSSLKDAWRAEADFIRQSGPNTSNTTDIKRIECSATKRSVLEMLNAEAATTAT